MFSSSILLLRRLPKHRRRRRDEPIEDSTLHKNLCQRGSGCHVVGGGGGNTTMVSAPGVVA